MNKDTSEVNLNIRKISKVCTLTIALHSGSTVTTHSVKKVRNLLGIGLLYYGLA